MSEKVRRERDSLGELAVPSAAYYGIQTLRALQNFPISARTNPNSMVTAVVRIKKAAAGVHEDIGFLDRSKSRAIIQACDEILAGKLRDQFKVDVFQMGAGTAFHMNCNEVIANRAEEVLGGVKGEYKLIHPNDHVNMGQSTNDVFPTAMRLAVLSLLEERLYMALDAIAGSFQNKAVEFDKVIKSGRTHLQDAAPIRLGQEFGAYGKAVELGRTFLAGAARSLLYLGIGGSAVGTGLNTTADYPRMMIQKLSDQTGFSLLPSEDLREAMQSMRPFTEVSAALRNIAFELNRIANDLRLLCSGPRTGLAEITVPSVAPGSSAMPGKVNPSMLEMLNMVCYQIIGCDGVIAGAAQAGQLELNVMMPIIAYNLDFMISILANALKEVRVRCVDGIEADVERCRQYAEGSQSLVTALIPHIGYAKAAEVARAALEERTTLREVLEREGLLTGENLDNILNPFKMTEPGVVDKSRKKDS